MAHPASTQYHITRCDLESPYRCRREGKGTSGLPGTFRGGSDEGAFRQQLQLVRAIRRASDEII